MATKSEKTVRAGEKRFPPTREYWLRFLFPRVLRVSVRKEMKKVKGFTTMELSIVMLMAALISGLANGGYSLFSKQIHSYSKKTGSAFETQRFISLMKKDTYQCKCIQLENQSLKFDLIHYDFSNENYVLRQQAQLTDTFHLATNEFSAYLESKPNMAGLVDEIRFNLIHKDQENQLVFRKQYDNYTFITAELANGH